MKNLTLYHENKRLSYMNKMSSHYMLLLLRTAVLLH